MSFKNEKFRMNACEIPEFFRRIQSEVDQLTGQEPLSPKRYLQKPYFKNSSATVCPLPARSLVALPRFLGMTCRQDH